MSRLNTGRWVAGLLVTACLVGCGNETLGTIANLSGVNDLIQSGDFVFITSSDRDELRAIYLPLNEGTTLRDFERAPNPLEALSIPVVDDPVQLAVDQGWDAAGISTTGPYVYARSDGTAAISVVNAKDRTQLKEVRRVFTGNPVTAIAAAQPAADGAPSQLYYGTWDGAQSTLWEVDLPGPAAVAEATLTPRQIVSVPGTALRALLLLPTGELAMAVRPTTAQPRSSWVLDPVTLATRDLAFPIPVRGLYTHASTLDGLAAGQRIYAILDEEFCSFNSSANCPGFFVVDSQTGAQVLDVTGFPMTLPLSGGLPQGLILSSNAHLNTVSGPTDPQLPLLGVFTTSGGAIAPAGGRIFFFDANQLHHFDTNSAGPTVQALLEDETGNARTGSPTGTGPDLSAIAIAEGAVQDQNVFVTFQGLIPGLTDLPRGAGDTTLALPVSGRAMTNDEVFLGPSASPCGAGIPIQVTDTPPTATAQLLGPIPASCPDETLFSIRAMGAQPYPVSGSVDGYMGRTGPNSHYAFNTTYYFHPANYDPSVPALQFDFGAQDPGVLQDWRYELVLTSGYAPYFIYPDNTVFVDYYLPGAVALDVGLSRAFVAYPSTPSVMELDLSLLTPAVANGTESLIEHR